MSIDLLKDIFKAICEAIIKRKEMGKSCCSPKLKDRSPNENYKKVLWAALAINVTMFLVEIIGGIVAGSVSLQADAIDFLGDSGNYAISLFVLGMALRVRAKAAYFKGLTMACFGIWVFASSIFHFFYGGLPEAVTMGVIGFVALLSNALVLVLLWKYRAGDSNMRSVWLCSRNDVIGNFAVILAALGVSGTQSGLPDLIVASLMSLLALQGAYLIITDAKREMNDN